MSRGSSGDTGDDDDKVENIRELLGFLVGRRVVEILQHDDEEWQEERACFIELLFDDGSIVRFPVGATDPVVIHRAD